MGPYIFMEKMLIISNHFKSSEASGQVLLKFHVKPPWAGEWKIAKMGHGPLIKIAAMPIYGKNL